MFEECTGPCLELHYFTEHCVVCRISVHQLCVTEYSDIWIDEAVPIYGNKSWKASFPGVTLKMTAASDKTKQNEN